MCVIHRYAHTTYYFFFFFNDTATTEIYTLSLHDALPISTTGSVIPASRLTSVNVPSALLRNNCGRPRPLERNRSDRKSTRLNSSHSQISYAVFCLKKKKKITSLRAMQRSTTCEKMTAVYH